MFIHKGFRLETNSDHWHIKGSVPDKLKAPPHMVYRAFSAMMFLLNYISRIRYYKQFSCIKRYNI